MTQQRQEWVMGKRNVAEAIRSGNAVQVIVAKNSRKAGHLCEEASSKGIPVQKVDSPVVSEMTGGTTTKDNQGVAALVKAFEYYPWEDLVNRVKDDTDHEMILLLDHLQDPHNLGALLRTAEAAGVKHVVIPKDRAAQVTAIVRKVAAGAAEWVSVTRVTNLVQAIKELKEKGFWIYGASTDGMAVPYYRADWKLKIGLVLGSEEKGISRLVRENCDELLHIPMRGKLSSLNASVSGALFMYEFRRNNEEWR